MVETSHPQKRIIGEIPFLGHIWILRGMYFVQSFTESYPSHPISAAFSQANLQCYRAVGGINGHVVWVSGTGPVTSHL